MDDRTPRSRENEQRERTSPRRPSDEDRPADGRVRDAANDPQPRRSFPSKPPLTEREREEAWPLG